ncbi:SDR family NAD(P)-dependent oxidoreductase [Kitasatospora indigofera]|uniref:SDR family NAD(P)-dependent oxidoreductase n=1 Tax=Kitasatospora indigofera TaxID=67307 RepID=UPI00363BD064
MSDLSGRTTIVVGASRGLGHGIATSLAEAGAPVVAVSRTTAEFTAPTNGEGSIHVETADAADASSAGRLLDLHEPDNVVLVAGANPHMRPLQHHTWESFSATWETDVRITFHWLREILLKPLRPGARVIVISSGAALAGSPLSGGYAGAKATQRFITGYAQDEARRAALDITFTSVLPRMTPATELGRTAARAYAVRDNQTQEEYLRNMGPTLTPQITGDAIVNLIRTQSTDIAPAYLLTGGGLKPLNAG